MKPISVSMGFTRGANFFPSGAIRYLDGGRYNHVYWKFHFNGGHALIYESHMSGGVQITPYEHLLSAKTKGKVLEIHEVDMGATSKEATLLWNDCIPLHHKGYDRARIMGYYAWIRFTRREGKKVLNLHNKDRYTCNEFVVETGRRGGIPLMDGIDFSYTIEPLYRLTHDGKSSTAIVPKK